MTTTVDDLAARLPKPPPAGPTTGEVLEELVKFAERFVNPVEVRAVLLAWELHGRPTA